MFQYGILVTAKVLKNNSAVDNSIKVPLVSPSCQGAWMLHQLVTGIVQLW